MLSVSRHLLNFTVRTVIQALRGVREGSTKLTLIYAMAMGGAGKALEGAPLWQPFTALSTSTGRNRAEGDAENDINLTLKTRQFGKAADCRPTVEIALRMCDLQCNSYPAETYFRRGFGGAWAVLGSQTKTVNCWIS